MMVTVFCSADAACLEVADLAGVGDALGAPWRFFASAGRAGVAWWTQRDPHHRLAAQRIVAEDGEARKDSQKQA